MNLSIFERIWIIFIPAVFLRLVGMLGLFFILFPLFAVAQSDWKKIQMPTVAYMEKSFSQPETAYGNTVTWGWDGPMTAEVIQHDLDSLYKSGFRVDTIEAGYRMPVPYLSEGWFALIKTAVAEAKKRGMRVWLIDEGKYPSGFAGGKFSQERPDLRMQGLTISERIKLSDREVINKPLPVDVVSAIALNLADSSNQILDVSAGQLNWPATPGNWQVILVHHQFKTAVTRAVNNPKGGKDTTNSLCDYLNPVAVKQFIEFTHQQYKKHVGDEFGKTILGFRGDEPDFAYMPWTPNIPSYFKDKKGYDIQPYLASFFLTKQTPEQKKAKADYWDIWSDLFAENFFKVQSDWCKKNGLEYIVHLNHDHEMMGLVKSEGDFFKNFRTVQLPGIDVIWNQIWPGKVADFPKFASSAAHLNGQPRAFSESFAAFKPEPDLKQARYIVNQQLVRGINLFEFMFFGSTAEGKGGAKAYMADPKFPELMDYTNRAAYVLAQGKPEASIAVFFPTTSLWLGHTDAEKSTFAIAQLLLESQHDFDFIDEYSLKTFKGAKKGGIVNNSGQMYHTVIVPSIVTISKQVLEQLELFAKNGGKVIFAGMTPAETFDQSFLKSDSVSKITWATAFTGDEQAARWVNLLPVSDLVLDRPSPAVKYLHRRWADAEVYFLFNESDTRIKTSVVLSAAGNLKEWDMKTGTVSAIKSTVKGQRKTQFDLELPPYGSVLITGDNIK